MHVILREESIKHRPILRDHFRCSNLFMNHECSNTKVRISSYFSDISLLNIK